MSFTSNPIYVLAILCLMTILAVIAGKSRWGKPLGAALLVILFTAVVANLKLIPSASDSIALYDGIFTYIAPISIFFLLLNVNLTTIKKAGLPMIGLFLIGSLATTIGILISYFLLSPDHTLGEDARIIAGMLTGTYTGGSINFNAVALEYDFQKKGILYAGTVAVDNVITTLWVIITLAIPAIMKTIWKGKVNRKDKEASDTLIAPENESLDLNSMMWLLFLGFVSYYVSQVISDFFPAIPFILILSTIGIALAQLTWIQQLKGSHNLGLYLVYLFLAVIGAYCELAAVVKLKEVGITLMLFTSIAVLFHGLILILLGGLVFRDWSMIAIVSQANIGGGTTAIPLAETFDRKELMVPAILVGTLGNALGTYLGFLVVYIL